MQFTPSGQVFTDYMMNTRNKRIFAAGDVTAKLHTFTMNNIKDKVSIHKSFVDGYYAAVNMMGLGIPNQSVYFEQFDMYNNCFQVLGNSNPFDEITIRGDINSLDFMIFYS